MPSTPRLRALAGPSPSSLTDISALVNTNESHKISSPKFEGSVVVHIKGFEDEEGLELISDYFERPDRRGITWSIQVQGRFLQPHSADDILFGNTFDRPLKLPWGSGAALKFMHYVDPTLEHDLGGPQPWALSPLIATMPYFAHSQSDAHDAQPQPAFPSMSSITDDTSTLQKALLPVSDRSESSSVSSSASGSSASSSSSNFGRRRLGRKKNAPDLPLFTSASKRRSYFGEASNRQKLEFGPQDVITTDFCYGFLSFPSLALNLPGGISFDLTRYWDGQPVRFVCCERGERDDENTFWCVVFELAE